MKGGELLKIELVKGDIFFISCDAIVNPTDVKLSGSGGLDRNRIYV